MAISLLEHFGCPCGEGAGRLISCVTSFAGHPATVVYRSGAINTLAPADHDRVYLEVCCPRGHVFFVEIRCAADGGSIIRIADAE